MKKRPNIIVVNANFDDINTRKDMHQFSFAGNARNRYHDGFLVPHSRVTKRIEIKIYNIENVVLLTTIGEIGNLFKFSKIEKNKKILI